MGGAAAGAMKKPSGASAGGLGGDAANDIRNAAADAKKKQDEVALANERAKAEQDIALEK